MDYKDKFKKGLIEMLLLKVLSVQDCYGYQITQILKKVSNNTIVVREPSMYPILYRLLEKQLISSYTGKGNGRMKRVYYHIEEEGKHELDKQIEAYKSVQEGTLAILNYNYIEDSINYAQ